MTYCCINGELVDASTAEIPLHDRGFRFGDGVFETIAVIQGVPYQFEWHMERLAKGLESIKIHYDTAGLRERCRQLLHKNQLMEGFLRIQVTRGVGSKGYLPDACLPTLVIETPPLHEISHRPVTLWQSSYRKISLKALPVQSKLCQGLNSTLARMEAQEYQCFDALLLNENGHVCETSSGNIFWRKNDRVYTPSLLCGVLEGSTRATILRLFPSITEVQAPIEMLMEADAVFITNVAWKAIAAGGLLPEEIHWDSESFASHFLQLLNEDRQHYCKLHHNTWR